MFIKIPPKIDRILQILTESGHEAYAVGGCVRDSLLGRPPKDWDVTTSARPEEVRRAFPDLKIIETGLKHGTVTVLAGSMPVEVTTYRIDGAYSDGRHPDGVTFTRSLEEDLARRDFTVNALACSRSGDIVDFFGGIGDLKAGILRCVGEPDRRFREDGLRILRALRFSSELSFSIEEKTKKSLLSNRALLDRIARERLRDEFARLLCGRKAGDTLSEYREVIAQFIPEVRACFDFSQNNPYHIYDVWEHILKSVDAADPVLLLRLVLFLHDLGKPYCYTEGEDGIGHFYGHAKKSAEIAGMILRRLRFGRRLSETAVLLVSLHDTPMAPDEKTLKRWLRRAGTENMRLLLQIKAADILAKNPEYFGRLEKIRLAETTLDRILTQGQCFSLRELNIRGGDLIRAGFPKGPAVGRTLNSLLNAVIDGKCSNTRRGLLEYASKMREEGRC